MATIEVMFNTAVHGKFEFSEPFRTEYNKRRKYAEIADASLVEDNFNGTYNIKRDDTIAIQLLKDLGSKRSNTINSNLAVCKISTYYDGYWYIHDCNGVESVKLDFVKYKYEWILEILARKEYDDADKIARIYDVRDEQMTDIHLVPLQP